MNFENLLIEGVGIAQEISDIQKGKIISYSKESLLNKNYFLNIYKTDDDMEEKEKIGKIEITYMDVWMTEEVGMEIFDLFDLIDSEKQGVYQYLYDGEEPNDEYVGMYRDVIYIDKVFIEKKYRNLGIGSVIIQELPRLIRNILKLRPGCIVLLANPFEIEEKEMVSTKIKRKYNKNTKKVLTFVIKRGYNEYNNKDTNRKSILSKSNVSRNPVCGVQMHR